MFKIKQVVIEGAKVPSYMGVAYHNFSDDTRVCWIVPLNWVVRAYRELQFYLRFPNYPDGMSDGKLGAREAFERHIALTYRHKYRNEGYSSAIYNLVGRFTMNEMNDLEDFITVSVISEKDDALLSNILENYKWLHDEYKELGA